MKKMFSQNKKIFFTLFTIFAVVGYGVFVFAAAPNGGYTPGSTLDPDCAPGDTDCLVAITAGGSVGIGTTVSNNPDLNGILYTDAANRIVTDSLFVRDNSTKDTFIGKDIQSSYTQDVMTLGPTIISDTPVGTFQQGETIIGQTSGFIAVVYDAHALPDPPQWVLSLSTSTGTFQQGETIVGQTSGATATVGLFADAPLSNGSSFTVLDINDNLNPVAQGVISGVLGGGQYTYTLNSGSVIQGGLLLDNPNNPTVISHVMSISSNQISTTNQASFQLGTLLSGILPGTTQGAGNFYTDAGSGFLVGQWVGQDGGGYNNTFNQVAFDMVNTRGVFLNGVLGDAGTSPLWNVGVVDLGNNWTGGINIAQDSLEISHTNEIGLFANRIVVGANSNSPAYILPTARGTAGQVLMDFNGDGNLSWQTLNNGGGNGTPGGSSGSLQFNNGGLFDGTSGAYWDLSNSRLGIGTTTPSARLAIRSAAPSITTNAGFSGNGLNDATFSGAYTGNTSDTFIVSIDSTNSPNTFSWSSSGGSGSNIPITGSAQYLTDGISITFTSTDGHTINNQWQYMISAGNTFSGSGLNDATFSGAYSGISNNDTFSVSVQTNNQELVYSSPTGAFIVGEVVTGIGSGSAGVVTGVTGGSVNLKQVVGIFNPGGEQIIGSSSGAIANLDSINPLSDMFSWYSNYSGSGSDIIIDGTQQSLGNGITIQFGSTTGHTNSDTWFYSLANNNSFSGTGQNDMSFTGTYTGIHTNDTFTVVIDSTSIGGDTFSWNSTDGSGANIPITGSTQYLYDGISISFNSINGHTLGNQWQYTIAPGGASTTFAVTSSTDTNFFSINSEGAVVFSNPAINIGGISYVFPNTQAIGAGYVLTNDGAGNLTWEPGGSASSPFTLTGSGTMYSSGYGTTGNIGDMNIFIGDSAGYGTTGVGYSTFIGFSAGSGANNVQYSNFLGYQSGMNAANARDSNFFGVYSGMDATNAEYSNFMGRGSGAGATDANNSNFFGYSAGVAATNAFNSNFMGVGAGYGASGANNSNFFGLETGLGATGAYDSTFIGKQAGKYATNAFLSIFMGDNAGTNASGANQSNFFGNSAGYGATAAMYSNFIGNAAGLNAANASSSNFLGSSAGNGATDAYDANFFGQNAGQDANNAHSSNFIGFSAGNGANNAQYSNFFGSNAGFGADDANNSNFSGQNAGMYAPNANNSNFYGLQAGYYATNANNSNFIGTSAGREATDAAYSTFIGENAGYQAATAADAVFIGTRAGYQATDAWRAVFTGYYAGAGATNAHGSVFSGYSAGQNATDAPYSVFLGTNAGSGATNAADAVFLGISAGQNATDAVSSVFLGKEAGSGAASAYDSIFIGRTSGKNATSAQNSNFIGVNAGDAATNAYSSNFIGSAAGKQATNSNWSNFIGLQAGFQATNASGSNFIGTNTGQAATNATYSNFIGFQAGEFSANASNSNFFGQGAGYQAPNASNSIFIGQSAGLNDIVNNTGSVNDFSILIGKSTSTGGFSNSIAIGGSATNTASNQFMIGSTTRAIDTTVWKGSAGTTCTLTTGTGVACSSDERLKTNVTDLTTDTLEKLLNLKTVKYNWLQNPTSATQIGFLAQDLGQYFPELVATDSTGYKSVYYSQITPVLVEAIREMNLKITTINDMDTPNTWRDALTVWFGNINNGITKLFANEIETKTLCVSDDTGSKTCITKSQLDQLLNNANVPIQVPNQNPTPNPDPVPTPDLGQDPGTGDNNTDVGTGDTPSDTGTPPADAPTPASDPAPTE